MVLIVFMVFLHTGEDVKSNIEVIILVSTGAAATFLWIMLILFIRKLRKVRILGYTFYFSCPCYRVIFINYMYLLKVYD